MLLKMMRTKIDFFFYYTFYHSILNYKMGYRTYVVFGKGIFLPKEACFNKLVEIYKRDLSKEEAEAQLEDNRESFVVEVEGYFSKKYSTNLVSLKENYNVDYGYEEFYGVHIFPERTKHEYCHGVIEDSGYKNFNPEPLTEEEVSILKQIGKDFGIDDIKITCFLSSDSS